MDKSSFIKFIERNHSTYTIEAVHETEKNTVIQCTSGERKFDFFISVLEDGFFFKCVTKVLSDARCKVSAKNVTKFLAGDVGKYYRETGRYKLYVPTKGIPVLTYRVRKYLSPVNLPHFLNNLDRELVNEIVRYSCPSSQWWVDSCGSQVNNYSFTDAIELKILRKCTSLQQFLTRSGIVQHPVSTRWFADMHLSDIVMFMAYSSTMNNPVTFLQNASQINAHWKKQDYRSQWMDHQQTVVDTVRMCAKANIKFTYYDDIERLKKQHDKAILSFLEHAPKIHLNIGKVFIDFAINYPGYRLIDDGNALTVEGKLMRHCVASRDYQVNQGTAAIFHIDYPDIERGFTMQVNYSAIFPDKLKQLRLYEIKGFCNAQAPEELVLKIKKDLTEFNDKYLPRTTEEVQLEQVPEEVEFDLDF